MRFTTFFFYYYLFIFNDCHACSIFVNANCKIVQFANFNDSILDGNLFKVSLQIRKIDCYVFLA